MFSELGVRRSPRFLTRPSDDACDVGHLSVTALVRAPSWCLAVPTCVSFLVCTPSGGNNSSVSVFQCQRLNTATSSSADYVIPQKLLDSIFNKLPVFMRPWEKEKAALYPAEVLPPYQTTFMLPQWQGNVLNLREINRNNTHTALSSVLTYYG
jgi:hypothetical protein